MKTTQGWQRHYRKTGYLLLPGFFDTAFINALTPIADRIFEQWLAGNRDSYVKDRLINMHSLSHADYFVGRSDERIRLFNLIANEKLVHLCASLFSRPLYFHNTQLFFNPLDRNKPTYWHRDLQYTGIDEDEQIALLPQLLNLHARIPLVPERGLEVVPETHLRWDTGFERSVRLELDGRKNDEALPGAQRLDLEPGDLLIFNAHMLHRGNYALNNARKAFDILIGAPHPLMTKWLDAKLLPERDAMAPIGFPQWYHNAWDSIG